MFYQIVSQWRMILTAVILIALAALALVKSVSVLAEDGGQASVQPRQTVPAPVAATDQEAPAGSSQAIQATPRPPAGTSYHTVQTGETLGKIAAQYGMTTAALAKANGIANPNLIRVGQRLVIPAH
jgi:LysM repeat protein